MAAILLMSTTLAGCRSGSANEAGDIGSAGGADARTAVYGTTTDPALFWDPAESQSNEIIVLNNIYETLLRYHAADDSLTPVLAESYAKSADGLHWTFRLKKNVKFHSGKVMTSKDVQRSFERTMRLGKGAAYILDPIASIDTPDESTVVFNLKYACALDLIVSAPYAAFIYNTDELDKNGPEYFSEGHEDGTGPYELKSWSPGKPVVLEKFPRYHEGWSGPHYENVVFKAIPDVNKKAQLIEKGELTYVDVLSVRQLNALKGNPNVQIVSTPSYQNLIAFFNTRKGALANPKVRQALSLAFPYDRVISDIMGGTAAAANGLLPKGLWGHDDSLPKPVSDIAKAQALLDQAGVKDLSLTLTYTKGDDNKEQIAEAYQASLSRIGVKLTLKPMSWEAQWALAKSDDPFKRQDIFMMYWWPDYADPYGFMYRLFHSEDTIDYNLSYYSNTEVDTLIEEASVEAGEDREQAARMYARIQAKLNQDYPAIWVYDAQYVRAVSSRLQGFEDNPAYPNVVFWYDVRPS